MHMTYKVGLHENKLRLFVFSLRVSPPSSLLFAAPYRSFPAVKLPSNPFRRLRFSMVSYYNIFWLKAHVRKRIISALYSCANLQRNNELT